MIEASAGYVKLMIDKMHIAACNILTTVEFQHLSTFFQIVIGLSVSKRLVLSSE
jgi:hypothetical protein